MVKRRSRINQKVIIGNVSKGTYRWHKEQKEIRDVRGYQDSFIPSRQGMEKRFFMSPSIFRDSQDYASFLLFYVLWAILVRFLLSHALMLCPASFAAM